MKKNLFMVAAVALMAMVSCNKMEDNGGIQTAPASDVVFTAEVEVPGAPSVAPASVSSRTVIGAADDEGNRAVTWALNDAIKVNGVEFKAQNEGARADFKTSGEFDEAETYYAVYPAACAKASDLSAVEIPASQSGEFADAAIAVAVSDNHSLNFMNVASILKFQVPAAAKEVTIEAASTNLAGTVKVELDAAGKPTIKSTTGGSKTITLTGTFTTGKDYYVALLPGNHQLTVKIDDFTSYASSKTPTFARAAIKSAGVLPALDLLYLVPNVKWKEANARFAAYFFNSDTENKWVDLKEYNGVYACEKENYTKVIFCRMNPAQTANKWENKWSQTPDMVIGDKPYCVIPFDAWTQSIAGWSTSTKYNTSGYLYLAPNSDWRTSNAWFAAYFFVNDSNNKWVKCEHMTDTDYYRVAIPSGYSKVIFCRMDSGKNTLGWDAKWNQTDNLTFNNTNYFYEITGWDKSGKWVTK